jgi:hypothetical protein
VCAPEVIRVKAPPPKVIVETPPPTTITQAQLAGAVPQAVGVPQSITQVPAGRARLGFAFDVVRIPLPILRPIAVPTTPEYTMQVAAPQYVTTQAVAPQAFVPQAYVPQAAVAPQAVAQATVPVQGHAVVPVQGHAVVPVQGHAVVPVQGQAVVPTQDFMPQGFVAQGMMAPQGVFAPQGVVVPQAVNAQPVQTHGRAPTPEEADEFCRQWQALRAKQQGGN